MGHDSVTAPRLFRERRLHRAQKDQTKNKVIQNPGEACAEERQGGEQSKVARLGVHSRSRLERGSDWAAPPSAS